MPAPTRPKIAVPAVLMVMDALLIIGACPHYQRGGGVPDAGLRERGARGGHEPSSNRLIRQSLQDVSELVAELPRSERGLVVRLLSGLKGDLLATLIAVAPAVSGSAVAQPH